MKRHLFIIKSIAACLLITLLAPILSFFPSAADQVEATKNIAAMGHKRISSLANPFQAAEIPADYALVGETAENVLYANMESGNFIFGDKRSRRLWHSIPEDLEQDELTVGSRRSQIRSMLLVDYVDMRTVATSTVPEQLASFRDSVENDQAVIKKLESGIRIEYSFDEYGIWLPLEITLTDNALSVQVKSSELKETSYNHVTAVHVLPCFAAAGIHAEEGYLFIPDGSGAIVELNNQKGDITDYTATVYGPDRALEQKERPALEQSIIMPVFGLKSGSHALMGIITHGAENSQVYANVSAEGIGYNRIYSKMVTAVSDSTTLFEADYFNMREIFRLESRAQLEDYEIQYFSLSGERASYAGMADNYRAYLIENGLLSKQPAKPSLNLNFYGATEKQASFLGIPYQKLIALTTFEQAKQFIDQLNQAGVDRFTIRYSGWNNYGLKNKKLPSKAKPLSVLGGKKQYLALQNYLESIDAEFYSDVDFLNFEKSGNSFSTLSDVSMSMFNMRAQQYEYLRSVYVPSLTVKPWYLLKPQKIGQIADKFFTSFGKLNSSGGVSLSGIGQMLYSDFDKNGTDRTGALKYYQAMLEKQKNTALSVEHGNAYTLPYIKRVFSMPCTSSENMIFDETVPFAQIVLHGYMPYSSEDINRSEEPQNAILKCIETGSDPYFCGMYEDSFVLMNTTRNDLYSSDFSVWSDQSVEIYKKYSAVYEHLYDKKISSHSQVADRVFCTSFEDGTDIYVNYSDSPQTVHGITVQAKDFSVKGVR